mmetsp:Transcript_13504/g.28740  ORF Transcript_13504/g.28740 Transcript_13504/m.28740 type:complete len:235 (-) Transcript_13504:1137-1841(-)
MLTCRLQQRQHALPDLGRHVCEHVEGGLHDEGDEAHLAARHHVDGAVADGGDGQGSLPLLVALQVELVHQQLRPLPRHRHRLPRVADVGAVQDDLEEGNAGGPLPIPHGLLSRQLLRELLGALKVVAHVCTHHHLHEQLPQGLVLGELHVLEDVAGGVLRDLEGEGEVVVLVHAQVVVDHGPLVLVVHLELVRPPRVADVVDDGAQHAGKDLLVREVLGELPLEQHDRDALEHV